MLAALLLLLKTDEEKEQFAQFYRQYENLMFQTARQILDSQQDCEDVVQSSCVYLIDHFDKYASYKPRQVAAYLTLWIRNRAKDLRDRKQWKTYGIMEDIADTAEGMDPGEPESPLESALEKLPERYRDALILRYYNGLSIKELAAYMTISESTARKLLQRSRDSLEKILTEEGGGNA
ncbi:MAG: sigma-70 family RNA polymerase sigma factor [Firmicutes bacterium]|nr:sigma-70 family RNA polymerase sigma factor [Bacillota bacterium]